MSLYRLKNIRYNCVRSMILTMIQYKKHKKYWQDVNSSYILVVNLFIIFLLAYNFQHIKNIQTYFQDKNKSTWKILKTGRVSKEISSKETSLRLTADFSFTVVYVRRQKHVFKRLQGTISQNIILYSANLSFKNEDIMKNISADIQDQATLTSKMFKIKQK